MIITHQREKLLNAIVYFAKHTKLCGKTKLLKLLYFLDFCHFKQTGKSVTGLTYFTWEKGPVPKELFEELSGRIKSGLRGWISVVQSDDFQKIVPKKNFSDEYFTNREKGLLEEISFIFKDARAEDMVEVTHLKNQPWQKTLKEKGQWKAIDYLLAIDDAEDSLSYAEAQERMEEISETYKIFGTS